MSPRGGEHPPRPPGPRARGPRAGVLAHWAAVLLLALTVSPVFAASERQAKEKELEQLRASIASLREEMDAARGRYDVLRRELRTTEERIGEIAAELRRLDGRLEEQNAKLADLQHERRRLEGNLTEQRGRLAKQIRAAYMMGRQEYVKILLNQEDPATLGRMMGYYDYLNRARSERINLLIATLDDLAAVRESIRRQQEQLAALREQQLMRKRDLENQRTARATVIAKLKRELSTKGAELDQLLENEKELERLIARLAEALADIPAEPANSKPFPQMRGKLRWPTPGGIAVGYGAPRSAGGMRWQGVLIAGDEGAPVRAVSHGRVAFADWLRGYGLLTIIDHGDGYMSLYGYNQSLYKEPGDWVEAGELIASVGNSGGRDRPGLYFEIRRNGRPTNPTGWCRLAAR